jgi:hypothetical protein
MTKRRLLPNHRANSKPAPARLSVYDGTVFAGLIDQSRGLFRAYDAAGALVGTFKTQRDAMCAIPRAS